MIINQREMARSKCERLKNGFSTFSETTQVTEFIERYIRDHHLHVHIDKTPFGNWFIPIKE